MKVTFDIPDETRCAFLSFVFQDGYRMNMGIKQVGSAELYDGAVLLYEKLKEDGQP